MNPPSSGLKNLLFFYKQNIQQSAIILKSLSREPGLAWLKSTTSDAGFEWITAWPTKVFRYYGKQRIESQSFDGTLTSFHDDFFAFLKAHQGTPLGHEKSALTGGLVGTLSYDLGLEMMNVPSRHQPLSPVLAVVGKYDWMLRWDRHTGELCLFIQEYCPESIREKVQILWNEIDSEIVAEASIAPIFWSSVVSNTEYQAAFESVQSYILAGDAYQVNLTRPWLSEATESSDIDLYIKLIGLIDAPFSIFHRDEHFSNLSVSPERFIKIDKGHILTQPIKGSRPRSSNKVEDEALLNSLINSEKDQAENLMIVDLLRNDISKNAVAGSVKATKLFEPKTFKNVHHLVSSIEATIAKDKHPLDVFADAFPGGSITGAPKKRAMEIIDELEWIARGLYCGSSFVLGANNYFDSNILIRTLTYSNGRLICNGGGGLVADSNCEDEFEESAFKIQRLLDALA